GGGGRGSRHAPGRGRHRAAPPLRQLLRTQRLRQPGRLLDLRRARARRVPEAQRLVREAAGARMRDVILLLILAGCTPEAPKAPATPMSSYAMRCERVDAVEGMRRCENKEAVCYGSFEVGLSCHWK